MSISLCYRCVLSNDCIKCTELCDNNNGPNDNIDIESILPPKERLPERQGKRDRNYPQLEFLPVSLLKYLVSGSVIH